MLSSLGETKQDKTEDIWDLQPSQCRPESESVSCSGMSNSFFPVEEYWSG